MKENDMRIYSTSEALEGKEDLKKEITFYSSSSKFEEDIWVLDRLKKSRIIKDSELSLYFKSIPTIYKDTVKYFVLFTLGSGKSYGLISTRVNSLVHFFNYVHTECNAIPLSDINNSIMLNFEIYLHETNKFAKSTKETIWSSINMFFKTMVSWKGMPQSKIVNNANPFSRTSIDRLNSQKYIPLNIINQLDKVFYSQDIKHHIKTIYWICRLIPSRISEITTLPIDCLRPYGENEYTLTLHMYKQNGGYTKPELRIIHLKYENMGKYLIDLIREQQVIAKNLQIILSDESKGFLFTYSAKKNQIALLSAQTVRENFNKILFTYKVTDENKNLYKLTPHQLRHNAITDRIYEGFSLLEIRDMTAHKSIAMLETSYIHPEKEQLKELGEKVNTENKPAGGVYFKGKIINADNPFVVKRLLAKPRAHKIGRLGICSDISGCKNDMFECFSCSFFVPNADELDYFKEQVDQWNNKIKLAEKSPLLKENAKYNLTLSEMIVKKIEDTLKEEGKLGAETS